MWNIFSWYQMYTASTAPPVTSVIYPFVENLFRRLCLADRRAMVDYRPSFFCNAGEADRSCGEGEDAWRSQGACVSHVKEHCYWQCLIVCCETEDYSLQCCNLYIITGVVYTNNYLNFFHFVWWPTFEFLWLKPSDLSSRTKYVTIYVEWLYIFSRLLCWLLCWLLKELFI